MEVISETLNSGTDTAGRRQDDFRGRMRWYALAVFFVVLFAAFFGVTALTVNTLPEISTKAEADSFDFTKNVAIIDRDLFDFYSGHLYTPADFDAGNTTAPDFTVDSENNGDRQYCQYGTYRLVLDLPAGHVYAMSGDSATYSQKVWVNGKLLSTVGKVRSSKKGYVPRTDHYTVCFTAAKSPTVIVIQRANFVHRSGTLFELKLGPQTKVFEIVTQKLFRSVSALGLLMASFLIFFGVALFFPDRKQYLWFALGCLSLCIRDCFVSPKPIMILFPELNWYFGHKLEHITFILAFLFMLMFYNAEFRDLVMKPVRYLGYVIFAVIGGIYLILPSTIYSYLTQNTVYVMIGYGILYVAFFLPPFIRRRSEFHQDSYILICIGAMIFVASSLCDGLLYRRTADYNVSQIGMLITVFFTAIALTMESRRVQEELAEANAREEKMRTVNQTLSDLYQIRTAFMSDISHEMKTPLTVMSSYAGLTKMQIEKGAVNDGTRDNLDTVQREAVRLAKMVERLKDVSTDKDRKLTPSRGDLRKTIGDTADFCRLICNKRNNVIKVEVPDEPLEAEYVPDSILQVLYNLITNASRHCQGSVISVKGEDAEDFVRITVTDRGDGISSKLLPMVFDRGVSGDKSSGIGLSLCRDIIEEGGGSIWVAETSGEGTSICFTVPKESAKDEQ